MLQRFGPKDAVCEARRGAALTRSYFACESFYNIAKVCKGEILLYFNQVFDALLNVRTAARIRAN